MNESPFILKSICLLKSLKRRTEWGFALVLRPRLWGSVLSTKDTLDKSVLHSRSWSRGSRRGVYCNYTITLEDVKTPSTPTVFRLIACTWFIALIIRRWYKIWSMITTITCISILNAEVDEVLSRIICMITFAIWNIHSSWSNRMNLHMEGT